MGIIVHFYTPNQCLDSLSFLPFAKFWRLSHAETRHFWAALVRSQSPKPCSWRQGLLFYQAGGPWSGSSEHLIDTISTPQVVITVLEALVNEQRLGPREARAIEAKILERVDRNGGWRG